MRLPSESPGLFLFLDLFQLLTLHLIFLLQVFLIRPEQRIFKFYLFFLRFKWL